MESRFEPITHFFGAHIAEFETVALRNLAAGWKTQFNPAKHFGFEIDRFDGEAGFQPFSFSLKQDFHNYRKGWKGSAITFHEKVFDAVGEWVFQGFRYNYYLGNTASQTVSGISPLMTDEELRLAVPSPHKILGISSDDCLAYLDECDDRFYNLSRDVFATVCRLDASSVKRVSCAWLDMFGFVFNKNDLPKIELRSPSIRAGMSRNGAVILTFNAEVRMVMPKHFVMVKMLMGGEQGVAAYEKLILRLHLADTVPAVAPAAPPKKSRRL